MPDSPMVSIITPAYNCDSVVHLAIESVLAQTMDDWELILVDDASADSTRAVMDAYARADRRIRIVRNEVNSRRGPIEWEPRNDGLKVARGPLLAYLDADNTWRPTFLRRLSESLLEDNRLQLVHCDSCNHYSEDEARLAIAHDRRKLVASGPTWTIFSHDTLDPAKLGVEQYIDTNEMMHRSTVFARLGDLWRTWHLRRASINASQGKRCPYRRHNDLDLFERVLGAYGPEAVRHLNEVHVDFYYPSATRPGQATAARPPITPATDGLHPQTRAVLPRLNVTHFYGDYLIRRGESRSDVHEFGVGEIDGIDGIDVPDLYREFARAGGPTELVARYDGTTNLRPVYRALADRYNHAVGALLFDEFSLAPSDGCHNALQVALQVALEVFTGTMGCPEGRDTMVYPVPSYPYARIAAASRRRAIAVEAYDAETFVAAMEAHTAAPRSAPSSSPSRGRRWVTSSTTESLPRSAGLPNGEDGGSSSISPTPHSSAGRARWPPSAHCRRSAPSSATVSRRAGGCRACGWGMGSPPIRTSPQPSAPSRAGNRCCRRA